VISTGSPSSVTTLGRTRSASGAGDGPLRRVREPLVGADHRGVLAAHEDARAGTERSRTTSARPGAAEPAARHVPQRAPAGRSRVQPARAAAVTPARPRRGTPASPCVPGHARHRTRSGAAAAGLPGALAGTRQRPGAEAPGRCRSCEVELGGRATTARRGGRVLPCGCGEQPWPEPRSPGCRWRTPPA
jgi:hypothetical protein